MCLALHWIVSLAFIFSAQAQTLISVKDTLGNHAYKELSQATVARWTPANSDTLTQELTPYLLDTKKWGAYKQFKDILQYQGTNYVLDEAELEVRGQKIPYWIVSHKNTPPHQNARALQVGLPSMLDHAPGEAINIPAQKLWLDKGGIVILCPLTVDDPMVLISGNDVEKHVLYQRWSDQFAAVSKHVLRSNKAGSIAIEAPRDTLFFATYIAVRYGEVYSRILLVQPEISTAVANPVTPPTPKTWPDYTIQNWYKTLITQEWQEQVKARKKEPQIPPVFIVVDSQNTFAGKMVYGFLRTRKIPVEYMEVSLWAHSDSAAKTARFQTLKYNYLLTVPQEVRKEFPVESGSSKKSKKKKK